MNDFLSTITLMMVLCHQVLDYEQRCKVQVNPLSLLFQCEHLEHPLVKILSVSAMEFSRNKMQCLTDLPY